MKSKDYTDPFEQIAYDLGNEDVRLKDMCDPYEFCFKYSMTLDPHDPAQPIKPIPDKAYLRELVKLWLDQHSLLVVKSRQMMVTWLFTALNLWLAMTQEGQYIFFISKKEDDAGFSTNLSLLSRAYFIFQHLPKEMQIRYKRTMAPSTLVFINRSSTMHGVSQDSDAVRQYTASSIFFDEMAFMEHAEQSYASIKPTLDGYKHKVKIGNTFVALPKFAGVSTPNGKGNLFDKLVHDLNE